MLKPINSLSKWLRGRVSMLAAVASILFLGIIAYASIPDANGVIHVCYRMSNGSLRVIDSAVDNCNGNEVPLSFNQTGPQGPQGESGLSGPQIVSGDYDGDGQTDPTIFDSGTWKIKRSSDDVVLSIPFGQPGDIPISGDYDGDTKTDLAVFRPSTDSLWILHTYDGSILEVPF